ncbi:MAG: alpha/beta hydrolase [Saprospiraceae bacterium]|nr:alpha/beta hydrolase [Candidatus Defluviibacterium haderslevense]
MKHPNEEQINVLYFKSSIPAKATVLFLHGARQSADAWAAYVPAFTERGLNVVIPDYRGYGKSYEILLK